MRSTASIGPNLSTLNSAFSNNSRTASSACCTISVLSTRVACPCRSNGRGPELTPAALEAHNNNLSSMSLASQGSAHSIDVSVAPNSRQLQPSAAYLARMAKVSHQLGL